MDHEQCRDRRECHWAIELRDGRGRFTATFDVPSATGPLYYQTQAIALYIPIAAEESDKLGGYLFNPSSARGEALGVIRIE